MLKYKSLSTTFFYELYVDTGKKSFHSQMLYIVIYIPFWKCYIFKFLLMSLKHHSFSLLVLNSQNFWAFFEIAIFFSVTLFLVMSFLIYVRICLWKHILFHWLTFLHFSQLFTFWFLEFKIHLETSIKICLTPKEI